MDFAAYHDDHAGRLVVDPEEARLEFGEKVAARLKLTEDGTKVLWPQPTDSPEDPQNWSARRKTLQLVIIIIASFGPDFNHGIGIAAVWALAKQFNTTTGVINNLTSNWSIFVVGWGCIFSVILIRRYGRLPVIFWSQILALSFLVGCTFAPNLKTFAAMRVLSSFFGTTPQVAGLYVVTDMYPFHLQARKLNIWTMSFVISPFMSPFALGFLVARANWRWAYGVGSMYLVTVLLLIVFLAEETMYDRKVKPIPPRPSHGLRYRVETLLGVTGAKMAKHRATWSQACMAPLTIIWRPHILGLLIFESLLFGFGIGLNVTNIVFLGMPKPEGYGFSKYAIAGAYGTPIVAVLVGEVFGHFVNDKIMNTSIKRNHGVFEAETRLWMCYIAVPVYICGFVVLGASLQQHLSPGALVIGWGLAVVAIMINTVAVYAYCNDAFPKHQGEVSALISFARTFGGFFVAYFQIPWARKHGALQTFGVEAAIVASLFVLVVPALQLYGRQWRSRFSL